MNVFVLNCGSSSLKFQIISTSVEQIHKNSDVTLCKGLVERIGEVATVSVKVEGKTVYKNEIELLDHKIAIKHIIDWITSDESNIPGIDGLKDINAIGHRTVHGGEDFIASVKIDEKVIETMEHNIDLAPLHNPANIMGIRAAIEVFGKDVPQVGVFDTSFHATMSKEVYLYALPYELYEKHKVRRYGFHGTSHRFVANRWRELTGNSIEDTNLITLHLGNGASMAAIKNGKSIDTSMGMTPLEGMIMGTRVGDVDPAIIEFLAKKENLDIAGVMNIYNKKSGVLGISGFTNDFRDLEEAMDTNDRAKLALDMFVQRIKKYIGSYLAEINGTKAIIFTGGIGENSEFIREKVCSNLETLGIKFDVVKNKTVGRGYEGNLATADSNIDVFVIPTNEELVIARDTACIIEGVEPV